MVGWAITPLSPCKHRGIGMRRYLLPTNAEILLSWVSQRCEKLSSIRAYTRLTLQTPSMRLTQHACTGGFTQSTRNVTASHCWHHNPRMMSWFGARLNSCSNERSLVYRMASLLTKVSLSLISQRTTEHSMLLTTPVTSAPPKRHPKAPPQ
jgi:hypothetical protein